MPTPQIFPQSGGSSTFHSNYMLRFTTYQGRNANISSISTALPMAGRQAAVTPRRWNNISPCTDLNNTGQNAALIVYSNEQTQIATTAYVYGAPGQPDYFNLPGITAIPALFGSTVQSVDVRWRIAINATYRFRNLNAAAPNQPTVRPHGAGCWLEFPGTATSSPVGGIGIQGDWTFIATMGTITVGTLAPRDILGSNSLLNTADSYVARVGLTMAGVGTWVSSAGTFGFIRDLNFFCQPSSIWHSQYTLVEPAILLCKPTVTWSTSTATVFFEYLYQARGTVELGINHSN